MSIRNSHRPALIPIATASALALILLAGCSAIDNDRMTVAGAQLPDVPSPDAATAPMLEEASGPSLTGIDRSNWPEQRIEVLQDGTRHHPRFTKSGPRYSNASVRNRGRSPTNASALDLGSDAGPQIAEGFSGPFWAGLDVLLFIPRAFTVGGPGAIVASPDATYERNMGDSSGAALALEPVVVPVRNDQSSH